MERTDNTIIVIVVVFVVVLPLSLLCRDVVHRQMVLRASESSVLFDCPKIRFCVFRHLSTQTTGTKDNNTTIATTTMTMTMMKDEGWSALDDNTDNTLGA